MKAAYHLAAAVEASPSTLLLRSSLKSSNPSRCFEPRGMNFMIKARIPLNSSDCVKRVVSGRGPGSKRKTWSP